MDPGTLRLFEGAASSAEGGYWIQLLSDNSNSFINVELNDIGIDGSGNVYACGLTTNGLDKKVVIIKCSSAGVLLWQRQLDGENMFGGSITVRDDGTVYVVTKDQNANGNSVVAKYNSAGSIQWQRRIGITPDEGQITTDNSGLVYVCGQALVEGGTSAALVTLDPDTGASTGSRHIKVGLYNSSCGIAIDQQGYIYLCVSTNTGNTNKMAVSKYTSTLSLLWTFVYDGYPNSYPTSIAADSSGDVYIGGYVSSESVSAVLLKIDSNGNILWQRLIYQDNESSTVAGYSVAVDTEDNIYLCGFFSSSGVDKVMLIKYDRYTTIQWTRAIGANDDSRGFGIKTHGTIAVCVCGFATPTSRPNGLLARIPSDGSLTVASVGGPFSYIGQDFGLSTALFSKSTPAVTISTDAISNVAATLPEAASSLTSSVTNL